MQMGAYYAADKEAKNRFVIIKTAYSKEIERANAFYNGGLADAATLLKQLIRPSSIQASSPGQTGWEIFLSKGKNNNVVFLPTTDESFASEVINILKKYNGAYEITFVGLPTWQYFQSVSPEDLRLLHTTIFSAVNISYESIS